MFIQRADLFRGMDQVVIKEINEIINDTHSNTPWTSFPDKALLL